MKLPLIPIDKANHIIYGVVIYGLASVFFHGLIPLMITTIFATAKEYFDYFDYGKFDFWDLVATISLPLICVIFK